MIITALTQKGNNVVVCFDDGELISLEYRTVLDNGLRKNDTIDEKKKEKLLFESTLLKAKDSAFRFLGRRHHSTAELKVKLIKKKYPVKIIEKVLSELTEKNILNDESFARAFLEERFVKKKIGTTKLKAELIRKGINRKTIETVTADVNPEDSYENAYQLATRKYESLIRPQIDKKKIRPKIFSFLSTRGYESDVIMKVLNNINPEEDE